MEITEKIQLINVEKVKFLMKEKGVDEKTMAAKMMISAARLKNLLSGADQRYLRSDIVYKIANALDVRLSAFLNRY